MNLIHPKSDPLGVAAYDYFRTKKKANIRVESNIAEDDILPVSYLFRERKEMPKLEQIALDRCKGKVLDVGAGAGCHSLHLQKSGIDISALEISELCCKLMKERGIKNIIKGNFYSQEEENYNVLLFLMNGIGIAGTIEGMDRFFVQARKLLAPGGVILFDSSDIEYMYGDEDGSLLVNLNSTYYGELEYRMLYKDIQGDSFPWLFIDFETLNPIAEKHGFEATLLATGDHYDYLGMLKKK